MTHPITNLPSEPRWVRNLTAEVPGLEPDPADDVSFSASGEELTFADFIDVINPLQHLPVVSSIYRAITGDSIGIGARLLGGALFGGAVGFLAAGVTAVFEEATGGTIADHVVALFEDITGSDDSTQIAADRMTGTASDAPSVGAEAVSAPAPATVPTKSPVATVLPGAERAASLFDRAQGAAHMPELAQAPMKPDGAFPPPGFGDARSRQIVQKALDAQRAQAQLLLASLSTAKPQKQDRGRTESQPDQARPPVQPPPAIATDAAPRRAIPDWFGPAMERALDRYQASMPANRQAVEQRPGAH